MSQNPPAGNTAPYSIRYRATAIQAAMRRAAATGHYQRVAAGVRALRRLLRDTGAQTNAAAQALNLTDGSEGAAHQGQPASAASCECGSRGDE